MRIPRRNPFPSGSTHKRRAMHLQASSRPDPVVSLVTGASRGIGREIARGLGKLNWGPVAINYHGNREAAQGVAEEIRGFGGAGAEIFQADVGDIAQTGAMFDAIQARFNALPHVVVHNAGITRDRLFMQMKTEEWQAVINTKLNGFFHVVQPCIRGMIKSKWGRVISISSMMALGGGEGQVNYVAANAGIWAATRALALETVSRNVTVNAILPGYVETDMTAPLQGERRDAYLAMTKSGQPLQPSAIAQKVVELVERGDGITGQQILFDDGLLEAVLAKQSQALQPPA